MRRRLCPMAIALILALSCLCIHPAIPAAVAAPSFKDTGGHWSEQVVEKAFAMDLIKGYPGNIFKPEDPISRIEAIAIIIRAMGLEKKALALDYKKSGINLPPGMFWGQGHLVLAVQKGLGIYRGNVQNLHYASPITRKEVAVVVSLALKDKLKVDGDASKLSYSDSNKIDLLYKPYVASVTQNNIMKGIENNQFGPELPMKRGQMAALVVKIAQDGWFD